MHVSCERNPRPYDRGFDFHQFRQRTDFSPSTKMPSMDATYLVGKPRLRIFWEHISRKGICMDCLPFVSTMPTFNQLRNGMQLMEMSNCLDYRHSYPLKCDSLPWNSKFPSSSKTFDSVGFVSWAGDRLGHSGQERWYGSKNTLAVCYHIFNLETTSRCDPLQVIQIQYIEKPGLVSSHTEDWRYLLVSMILCPHMAQIPFL